MRELNIRDAEAETCAKIADEIAAAIRRRIKDRAQAGQNGVLPGLPGEEPAEGPRDQPKSPKEKSRPDVERVTASNMEIDPMGENQSNIRPGNYVRHAGSNTDLWVVLERGGLAGLDDDVVIAEVLSGGPHQIEKTANLELVSDEEADKILNS